MRYIGSCTVDDIEYSTYFLAVVKAEFIKASALNRDLIELLSQTNQALVLRDVLRNIYPDTAKFIESNNIQVKPLLTSFGEGPATSIKANYSYGVNMLVKKGSQDETLLCLTANVTPLF